MKQFLTLAVLLFITSPAFAQVDLGTSSSATNPQVTGDATTGLFSAASGTVALSSGGGEVMRVTGTGVGVGTTTPGRFLTVYGGSGEIIGDGTAALLIQGDISGVAEVTGINTGNNTNNDIVLNAATANILYLKSSNGNVGMGTSSPSVTLDIGQKTDAVALPAGTTGQRPTGVNGMMRYNSTLAALEAYVNGAWGILASGSSPSGQEFSAGQLQCSGANCSNSTGSGTLNYCPYKGNLKTTASQGTYTIPSACLSATLTSMYVGGTASSSVAASTLYYIYLWNTSGTWVLDAETGGHATDSSTGIEIKSGDNTKTLVGMMHTDANKHIMTSGKTVQPGDTNTVATWDNRMPTATQCGFTATRTETATSATEVNSENRCYFMNWGDAVSVSSWQTGSNNTSGALWATSIQFNSGGGIPDTVDLNTTANYGTIAAAPTIQPMTEGFHYTIFLAATISGATVSFPGNTSNPQMAVYTVQ